MRLFGHYVARPVAAVAALDAILFLGLLHLFSLGKYCSSCYVGSFLDLKPLESLTLTAIFLVISISVGVYNRDALQEFRTFLKRYLLAWHLILLSAVAVIAVTKATAQLPFGWYVGILTIAIATFMAIQFGVRSVLFSGRNTELLKKRVLVMGDGPAAEAVVAYLNGAGGSHLAFAGCASPRQSSRPSRSTAGNLAVAQAEERRPTVLTDLAETARADMIVVAVEDKRGLAVDELLECKFRGVEVVDALTFWEREAGEIDFARTGEGWLAFTDGFVLDARKRAVKRAFDFLVSLTFLILFLPVILVVALAVKLESPGPVIYRQERVGRDGKVFEVWKFRSMRTDAESDGVPRWAAVADDRITRVGRIIRKLRLDEIPQIVNVLRGEMSFVGPRPERPYFTEQLCKQIPHYDLRHKVKPGITGWAQVNFPYGETLEDSKRKLAYDLYYVKNCDLVLDLAILAQTVRVVLFAHGAR